MSISICLHNQRSKARVRDLMACCSFLYSSTLQRRSQPFEMGIEGDLVWGGDDESEVFAQAQNNDLCLIFRYSLHSKLPWSLPSRIVNCFHCLQVEDRKETFVDRDEMRKALYSSIHRVWDQCAKHPSITSPDVTIEIYEDAEGQDQWRISHESLYKLYVESLLPVSSMFQSDEAKLRSYDTIDYSTLAQISHLGGRGRTTVVRNSSSPDSIYVFKGVDFGSFLESRADFEHRKDVCYHEIRTICSLPQHPNVIPSPNILVTIRPIEDDRRAYVCGALYPFMKYGTLDDQVQNTNATAGRPVLVDKAKWCLQMASAVAHTHFTAHTFHMDIKPANFVVNANKDLILIDWEQSGAWQYSLAPEADGSWDVKYAKTVSSYGAGSDPSTPKLVYDKYCGPARENLAWGRPKWNVFPNWRDFYPRALEAAEVFSLGRSMWMLLEQVPQSRLEDTDNIIVSWSEDAKDIPEDWKTVVTRCLDPDPNKRIGLLELVDFWEAVKRKEGRSLANSSRFLRCLIPWHES